ncbi:MAG TPA: tripartite tricarboxylate transporter substrate binding protein [Burkholderiales bacterium]
MQKNTPQSAGFSFTRRRALTTLLAAPAASSLGAFPLAALAQDKYPTHSVRMLIPFAPAGPADVIGRLVADRLERALGKAFVVDNRGGGNGNIAGDIAAHAEPDGYTLMLLPSAMAANVSLYNKLPYSLTKDMIGVAGLCIFPLVLVAHPSVGIKTVPELIKLAKAKPGAINFSSAGSGGGAHLAAEAFAVATGTSMTHVPYKGTGPAVAGIVGGQVQIMFGSYPSVVQQVKAGKLVALGVTSAKRNAGLPDVPAIAEFVPGYEIVSWFGLVAPTGTPAPIVSRLSDECAKIIKDPEFLEHLKVEGGVPMPMNAPQFETFIKKEVVRWAGVVKASGAKLD